MFQLMLENVALMLIVWADEKVVVDCLDCDALTVRTGWGF
jgi:hypothetical protein